MIRLEQARQQARALEDAVANAREKYASADPHTFAAYLSDILDELYSVRERIDQELGISALRREQPSVWLTLRGASIGHGRAPAHVIGKLLESVQKGVRQAAAFLETGTAVAHHVPREIGLETSLEMVAFAPGSARIALAPSPVQLRLDRQEPLVDLALQRLLEVTAWAEAEGADGDLDRLLPNAIIRRQALSRVKEIAPSRSAPYGEVEISGPAATRVLSGGTVSVTRRAFEHASEFLKRRQEEETVFGGRLVEIDTEKNAFELRHKRHRIRCHFTAETLPEAITLIQDFIEVRGTGKFYRGAEIPDQVKVTALRRLTSEERGRLTGGG
jgi:hypothetical protein